MKASLLCVLACAGLLLMPATAGAITGGQLNDFEDETTQGWISGGFNPNPPVNVNTGGPAGADDAYLRATSSGNLGAGGRLVIFNQSQWAGDYLAAGVTFIEMDMANFGATALTMRVTFRGDGGDYSSINAVSVPADGVWRHYQFPIEESDLTGGFDFAATMSNVFETRILHASFPTAIGDIVAAQLGIDNITCGPIMITQWQSVRTHGGGPGQVGMILDLTASCSGGPNPTMETRGTTALGIGIQKIWVIFSGPVTLVNPSGITITGRTTSGGTLGPSTPYAPSNVSMVDPDVLEMTFLGAGPPDKLPDKSWFLITIGPSTISETLTGDNDVEVRSLQAGTTMNTQVNLGDVLFTLKSFGAAIDAATAQHDIDLNGVIDGGDRTLIKSLITSPPSEALCPP